MSIVKLAKFDTGFEQLPRDTLQDPRLSLSALGALVRMLSLPNTWEIRLRPLEKEVLHVGPDLRKRLFKELIEAGYIKRSQSRNLNGTWDWDWTVFPTPTLKANASIVDERERFPDHDQPIEGEPMDGKAIDGSTIDEKCNDIDKTDALNTDIDKPQLQQPQKQTCLTELDFFYSFSEAIREQALLMLDGLDFKLSQQLLDELSGMALNNRIKVTPISVLKGLLNSHHKGKFTPNLALEVQSIRKQRLAEQGQSKQTHDRRNPSSEAREKIAKDFRNTLGNNFKRKDKGVEK